MKYLLSGYHDNRPMNKYFLLIFAHFGLKTTSFLNAHKNYRCKVSTLKLGEMIALFMLNLKSNFNCGRRAHFLGGTGRKIGLKMENVPNSGMFRGNISSFPREYQNLSSYIFLAYNIHLFGQKSPKNPKKLHFCIISKVFPQLCTSLSPYFWDTSSKLTYVLMCSLIV